MRLPVRMAFDAPKLVHDNDPSILLGKGKHPVVRFAGDDELRPLLGQAVVAKARVLAEAAEERVLAEAADFATAFRAYLRENAITDEAIASVAAQDGHAPGQFIAHAEELALAVPDKRLPLAANMRRSFENFCRAAGIADGVLQEEVERVLRERGGYEMGIVLERVEEWPKTWK